MQSRIQFISVVILLLAGMAIGQMDFPYVGEITGDSVNVRSGPGQNYYACGQLDTGDRVTVVGTQFTWSRIAPLSDSFSWISKRYVQVDSENPELGVVTGDNVRVYAGSNFVRPIHSTTLQGRLDKGDHVIIQNERDEYYQITPPEQAYLWISSDLIRPLGPVGEVPLEKPVQVYEPIVLEGLEEDQEEATTQEPFDPNVPVVEDETAEGSEKIVKEELSEQAKALEKFYEVQAQIAEERKKPVMEQDYSEITAQLQEIMENEQAGRAARFAEHVMAEVERLALGRTVIENINKQSAQLEKNLQKIEQAREKQLEQIEDTGRFAIIGTLRRSSISSEAVVYFRVMGESGTTICYATPVGKAAQMDVSKFEGKKVGLIGQIESSPQIGTALVRFSGIELIEE